MLPRLPGQSRLNRKWVLADGSKRVRARIAPETSPALIEEIRHRILTPLDTAIDRGIENWRLLAALVPGGTILFLFLFLVFGVSFGTVFLAAVFLGLLEVGIGGGIFLLDVKFRQQINQWAEAADAIEALISQDDVFGDWDQFISNSVDDPELERIRLECTGLPQQFPPDAEGNYCNEAGIEILEGYARRLRSGIATKGAELIWAWWQERRARKKGLAPPKPRRVVTTAGDSDAVQHMPRMTRMPSQLEISDRQRADLEAEIEARKAEKEEAKEARKADRSAKKAAKQEKKLMKAAPKKARKSAGKRRRAPAPPPPQAIVHESWVEEEAEEDEEVQTHAPRQQQQPGQLSEAGAIDLAMQRGFTADDYDRIEHRLVTQLGRQPLPSEVLRAMFNMAKGRIGKKRKKKRGRRRRTASLKKHEPRSKAPLVIFTLVVLVVSVPFVAWRVPAGAPFTIEGEVHYQALDTAPDLKHELRTYFEAMFGNKAVSLMDGKRLYVSEEDYEQCWPESWSEIYDKGYTMLVTAEVRPLLLGGYSVARISDTRRIDHPIASAQ